MFRIASVGALIGLVLFPAVASAQRFFDAAAHEYAPAIELLRMNGIVEGYPGNLFRPDARINRAEFLKILMRTVYGAESLHPSMRNCFRDFVGPEQWFWVYACTAKERGIVGGYPDGMFKGDRQVSMVEALKMTTKAWQIPLPAYFRATLNWYDPYVDVAIARGVFTAVPRYVAHLLTRGEVAGLLEAYGEKIAFIGPPSLGTPTDPVIEESGEEDTESDLPPRCGDGILQTKEECDDSNLANGDGCSEICVVVPEPVRHAALKIEQKAGGSRPVTGQSDHELLFSFTAVAGRQDVLLTGLKLKAKEGKVRNARAYRLLVDEGGAGVPKTIVGTGTAEDGVVVFSKLKTLVNVGVLKTFGIEADLALTETGGSIQLSFATEDPQYVRAVGREDGRELTGIETDRELCAENICWIAVATDDAPVLAIGETGSLYVTKGSPSLPSRQLLLGELGQPVLSFHVRAVGEEVAVTGLSVHGGTSSIRELQLFEKGGTQVLAILVPLQCQPLTAGKFCARSTDGLFTVDRERDLVLKVFLKTDNDGGTSGETAAFVLGAGITDSSLTARGVSSQKDLRQNDGDAAEEGEIFVGRNTPGGNTAILGATNDIVAAKITEINNSNPDPDNTAVSLGVQPFGRFRFQAAVNKNVKHGFNAVILTRLVFTVTAENLQASSFTLSNAADHTARTACTASDDSGTFAVTCSGLDTGAASTVIEQGTFIDLVLTASIGAKGPGTRRLQATVQNLGDRAIVGPMTWEDDVFPFTWVDLPLTQVRSTLYSDP